MLFEVLVADKDTLDPLAGLTSELQSQPLGSGGNVLSFPEDKYCSLENQFWACWASVETEHLTIGYHVT